MTEFLAGCAVLVVVGLSIRLFAGHLDKGRIEAYVKRQGWTMEDRSWDPLGPGWIGERDSRIYQIVFRDEEGNLRRAGVKTSMFSGVYLTDDTIIERPKVPPKSGLQGAELEAENRRLKENVEKLEKRLGRSGK